ncbi:MAG: hypothetical protein K6C98_02660 [Treponema sp.]|nr:hypothetical protein [Treponema sp.]
MKKRFLIILLACLTFSLNAASKVKTIEVPESFDSAFKKIAQHEKNKDYYYSFTAVNFGDATCEVKIYDKEYMTVFQPETKAKHYFYYKFIGDYININLNTKRSGIFGYAANLLTNEVFEIVFCNNFHGGYKFKNINDDILHDVNYKNGFVTWNKYPERKCPEELYFLDFFERKDKKLNDNHDDFGNYKDLAGIIYWSKTPVAYKTIFKKEE